MRKISIKSEIGTAFRMGENGALILRNNYQANISDEGMSKVFGVYVAEVLEANNKKIRSGVKR